MSDNPFGEPDDNERTMLRFGAGRAATPVTPPDAVAAGPAPQGRAPALAGEADTLPRVGPSPLAAAASPLLEMLARLGSATTPDAEELRQRALRGFRDFEVDARATGATLEEIRATHYVLCSALDDVALSTPWGAQSGWTAKSLVSTFHQETRSGERVFDVLSGMMKEPARYRGALEVTYLALSLGLQGKYRLMPRGVAELERVREGLFQLLSQLRGPWERELAPHWRGVDAPHRGPGRSIPSWVAGAAALLVFGLFWLALRGGVVVAADDLANRMAALPPSMPPVIERAAPPVPPAPPPVVLRQVSAVPKLRQFLAAEITEGLVTVGEDAQHVLVRLRNRGMFPSGSATVDTRFQDILRRVGEALRDEPGRVQVLGHSDNQPIRTVRFASNFALSDARAQAAMGILARANGQPDRFSAEGRAESEPLASNASAEGREENRRVEVILLRGGR